MPIRLSEPDSLPAPVMSSAGAATCAVGVLRDDRVVQGGGAPNVREPAALAGAGDIVVGDGGVDDDHRVRVGDTAARAR